MSAGRETFSQTVVQPIVCVNFHEHPTEDRKTQKLNEDVYLGSHLFKTLNIEIGDVIELTQGSQHTVVQVRTKQTTTPKDGRELGTNQISVTKALIDAYRFQKGEIVLKVLHHDHQHLELDTIEIQIKDQYIGRSDMWRLCQQLIDSSVFMGKTVKFAGMTVQVNEVFTKAERVSCGLIRSTTKMIFRTVSGMFYILFQITSEMFPNDGVGECHIEKASGFLRNLFNKWTSQRCNHEFSIILFGRMIYPHASRDHVQQVGIGHVCQNENGIFYQDFYKVVVNSSQNPDKDLLRTFKKAISQFPTLVRGSLPSNTDFLRGATFTSAADGNLLEAMNLALNALGSHYIDRSFTRTGLSLVVVTPGSGAFEVSPSLLELTRRRIVDDGIGCDLITLRKPALHITPVFRTLRQSKFMNQQNSPNSKYDFEIPMWIHQMHYNEVGALEEVLRMSQSQAEAALASVVPKSLFRNHKSLEPSDTLTERIVPRLPSPSDTMTMGQYDADVWLSSRPSEELLYSRGRSISVATRNGKPNSVDTKRRANWHTPSEESHLSRESLPRTKSAGKMETFTKEGVIELSRNRLKSTSSDDFSELKSSTSPADSSDFHRSAMMQLSSPPPVASSLGIHHEESIRNGSVSTTSPINIKSKGQSFVDDFNQSNSLSKSQSWGSQPYRGFAKSFERSSPAALIDSTRSGKSSINPQYASRIRNSQRKARAKTAWTTPFKLYNEVSTVITEMEMRWAHTFPVALRKSKAIFGESWKSLCEPATLPLTCAQKPIAKNLSSSHTDNNYDVYLSDLASSDHLALFERILDQRLSQCFQYCDSTNDDNFLTGQGAINTNSPKRSKDVTKWLAFGTTFHRLTYSKSMRTIKATVFRPRDDLLVDEQRSITYKLCPQYETAWVEKTSALQSASLRLYRWSTHDNEMAEGDLVLSDTKNMLRFWRVRYALIPRHFREKQTEIENFEKLVLGLNRLLEMEQKRSLATKTTSGSNVGPNYGSLGADGSDLKSSSTFKRIQVTIEQNSESRTEILSQQLTLPIATKPENDRDETLIINYDKAFHPDQAYHVEVQWHEATACLVSNLVERWRRSADTLGYNLTCVPIVLENQNIDSSETPNPFREIVSIPIAYAEEGDTVPTQLQLLLLKRFEFVWENDLPGVHPARRYVCRSGEALVIVSEPHSFGWCENFGFKSQKRKSIVTGNSGSYTLLQKMRDVCGSKEEINNLMDPLQPCVNVSDTKLEAKIGIGSKRIETINAAKLSTENFQKETKKENGHFRHSSVGIFVPIHGAQASTRQNNELQPTLVLPKSTNSLHRRTRSEPHKFDPNDGHFLRQSFGKNETIDG